jgi:hypothetical protein
MENTTFDFSTVEARGDYATPHGAYLDGTYQPIPFALEEALLVPIEPAGGAWSTVADMARYMLTMIERGVAPDGERVVSEDNLLLTWQPQVPIDASTDYGLGWILNSYGGVPVIGHDGNTLGMTSAFNFLPEQGIGIIVLSNGQGANLYNQGVSNRFLELVYEQPADYEEQIQFFLDQAETQMAELEASIGDAPTEADVEASLGDYSNEALGEVTIRYEDDQLVLDAGEFVTELRPSLTSEIEDGEAFVIYGSPLPGVSVIFQGEGDDLEMVVGEGVVEYTFNRE